MSKARNTTQDGRLLISIFELLGDWNFAQAATEAKKLTAVNEVFNDIELNALSEAAIQFGNAFHARHAPLSPILKHLAVSLQNSIFHHAFSKL